MLMGSSDATEKTFNDDLICSQEWTDVHGGKSEQLVALSALSRRAIYPSILVSAGSSFCIFLYPDAAGDTNVHASDVTLTWPRHTHRLH